MTDGRAQRWLVTSGGGRRAVRTRRAGDATLEVTVGAGAEARTFTATIVACSEDAAVVSIGGRSTTVRLAPHARGVHAAAGGESFDVTAADESGADARGGLGAEARAPSPAAELDALAAPMPATVRAVAVQPGAVVAAGDTLVRLEAMKMELTIRAPAAGRVAAVDCRVGDLVQPGRPLVTLEPRPAPAADEAH